MAAEKRYYWIKLKESFFSDDGPADFLMSQTDGANYVVLYQMLCLKTINTDGRLSNQIGEVLIPYDVEKIRRTCKYFSVDTIRIAMNLYKALGLIYEDRDGILVIAEHKELVGSETGAAARMRNSRANRAALPGVTNGEQGANIVTPEIRDKETKSTEFRDSEKRDQITEDLVVEEDARAGDPLCDPGFGKVMTYFMDKINPMPSPIAIGEIQFYLHQADLEPDVIIHAMQIAVDEKKTGWSYIKAILQRYAKSGLNRLPLVLSSEQQFEEQKAAAGQAPQRRSSKGQDAVSDLLSLHRRYEEQT